MKDKTEPHTVKYEKQGCRILKDGHTMFLEDVVTDLNRKAFLEVDRIKLLAQRDELLKDKERLLRALHDLILGWYDGDLKNKAFESAKAEIKALKG